MDLKNVQSEDEVPKKIKWPDVTNQGKIALKKIQNALVNQTSEADFRLEVMEALKPVFNEVYGLVKSNVNGFEEFLDQFPALHDLKHPIWSNMFDPKTFNSASSTNGDLKRQLTDMEINIKNLVAYMPTTDAFIKVRMGVFLFKY